MLNKIRDYLNFAGLQYRNPDKAGEEREKMLELRCSACGFEGLITNA